MIVELTIEINEDGAPRRASDDPGPMTPEQRQTYQSLYAAYKAEKHAWYTWFNLRQRFLTRRGPDKIAEKRDAHWPHAADHTERMLQEVH